MPKLIMKPLIFICVFMIVHSAKPIGLIKDTLFATWFFNIWLRDKTKLRGLRRQFLGMK